LQQTHSDLSLTHTCKCKGRYTRIKEYLKQKKNKNKQQNKQTKFTYNACTADARAEAAAWRTTNNGEAGGNQSDQGTDQAPEGKAKAVVANEETYLRHPRCWSWYCY
jgi:hypothetical protein